MAQRRQTEAEQLRAKRHLRATRFLYAHGRGAEEAGREADRLLDYAYQANAIERRDIDHVLATVLRRAVQKESK
jgi:hypothetical protein